jgi:streptogramin lyase
MLTAAFAARTAAASAGGPAKATQPYPTVRARQPRGVRDKAETAVWSAKM